MAWFKMLPPLHLSKISLTYSSVEDRMRMAGEVAQAEPVAVWLTQRICRLLVPQLVRFVEKSSPLPPGSDRALLLSFQQSAAVMNNDVTEPVRESEVASPALVERVDLNFHQTLVVLTFWLTPEQTARLALTVEQTFQWLDILYRQYCLAEWPLEAWPEWLADAPAASAAPESRVRMH